MANTGFSGQLYTLDQPTQLAFTQPPAGTAAGSVINPVAGVQVAVEDPGGTTDNTNSSVVTLTLSSTHVKKASGE
jgi:hypothetical protein